jgi:hypothetical protein
MPIENRKEASDNPLPARAMRVPCDQSYRIQEKEFHHEEHKDHEGGIGNIIIARLYYFSSLRVLRFFVVLFS